MQYITTMLVLKNIIEYSLEFRDHMCSLGFAILLVLSAQNL
jgi:hypothetical protein